MIMFTSKSNRIFAQVIDDYHRCDDVDAPVRNPYANGSIEYLLYLKNWIDTVQWHLEDIIRDPNIDPVEALKIYHMEQEVRREDVSQKHIEECGRKLDVLRQQQVDLSGAIDALLDDIAAGRKYMKVYKQMKMYNDPELNPVLYASK